MIAESVFQFFANEENQHTITYVMPACLWRRARPQTLARPPLRYWLVKYSCSPALCRTSRVRKRRAHYRSRGTSHLQRDP